MDINQSRDIVKEAITEAFAPLVEQERLNRKEVLTVEETALFLGVSRITLDHWRSQGKGPSYTTVGKRIAYRRKDLNDYLERNWTATA